MKLTTDTFNGLAVDIHVDSFGRFSGAINGQTHWGTSLDDLKGRLQKAAAKAVAASGVRVPVGIIDGGIPKNVQLVRHAASDRHSSYDILVRDMGTNKAGDPVRTTDMVYQLWTPETIAELKHLQAAKRAADDALDAYKRSHVLNTDPADKDYNKNTAGKVLDRAIEAKAAAQEAKRAAATVQAALDTDHVLHSANVAPEDGTEVAS